MKTSRARATVTTSTLRAMVAGLLFATAAATGALLPDSAMAARKVTVLKSATALPGTHYAWVPSPAPLAVEADPRVQDPQFRERLQAALDKALQAKGYQPAPTRTEADFYIAYRIGVRDVEQALVEESGGGAVPTPEAALSCSGGDCSQLVTLGSGGTPVLKVTTEQQVEGGLLVEVIEPRSIRVVWRALNRGTVKRRDVRQVKLDNIARDVLAQLPRAQP